MDRSQIAREIDHYREEVRKDEQAVREAESELRKAKDKEMRDKNELKKFEIDLSRTPAANDNKPQGKRVGLW